MPQVKFTPHLIRYFPDLENPTAIGGRTVSEMLANIDRRHPGLASYIVDDQGALRKHVHIYLGSGLVRDRQSLSDAVGEEEQVFVFQALSGG